MDKHKKVKLLHSCLFSERRLSRLAYFSATTADRGWPGICLILVCMPSSGDLAGWVGWEYQGSFFCWSHIKSEYFEKELARQSTASFNGFILLLSITRVGKNTKERLGMLTQLYLLYGLNFVLILWWIVIVLFKCLTIEKMSGGGANQKRLAYQA